MLRSLLISIVYWTAFLMVLVTVRFVGIEFFTGQELGFPLHLAYTNSVPGGIIMGVIWAAVNRIDQKWSLLALRSFGGTVALKTLVYFLIIVLVMFLGAWVGSGSITYARDYTIAPLAIGNIVASLIAVFLFVFFEQMDRKMGPGILLKYLTGRYYNPREEERIFMFLDLKSSTAITERIGHRQYSKLIQECYSLLTKPLTDHAGEIYQYVGDEAVISWSAEVGLENGDCLGFYFSYETELSKRREHFQDLYGEVPQFKAGVSIGPVMAVEVGELKSEIAYHGDVLNATARVQGYCNQLNENLLMTEALYDRLADRHDYEVSRLGEFELRGKEVHVALFGVRYGDKKEAPR